MVIFVDCIKKKFRKRTNSPAYTLHIPCCIILRFSVDRFKNNLKVTYYLVSYLLRVNCNHIDSKMSMSSYILALHFLVCSLLIRMNNKAVWKPRTENELFFLLLRIKIVSNIYLEDPVKLLYAFLRSFAPLSHISKDSSSYTIKHMSDL